MPNFEINISIPMQSNSISEVAKVTAPFMAELESIKQKLPEGASYKDGLTGLRAGSVVPRKSLAQRVDEEIARRQSAPRMGNPAEAAAQPSNGERRVPRGVSAG